MAEYLRLKRMCNAKPKPSGVLPSLGAEGFQSQEKYTERFSSQLSTQTRRGKRHRSLFLYTGYLLYSYLGMSCPGVSETIQVHMLMRLWFDPRFDVDPHLTHPNGPTRVLGSRAERPEPQK